MNPSEATFIYTTLPDKKMALGLAQDLLNSKLIACANVFPPHTAIYNWNGNICEDNEVAVLFKTTPSQKNKAMTAIAKKHPYECPCITAMDAAETHLPFVKWLNECTS